MWCLGVPGLWYRTTPFSSASSSLALRWQWQFSQTGWQFSQNQASSKNQANMALILAIWSYNSKYIILQLKIYVPTTQNILKYILIYFLSLIIFLTFLKIGSRQAPKSVDPKLCHSEKLFFKLFFGENPHFHPSRANVDPPFIYIVGKLWISAF